MKQFQEVKDGLGGFLSEVHVNGNSESKTKAFKAIKSTLKNVDNFLDADAAAMEVLDHSCDASMVSGSSLAGLSRSFAIFSTIAEESRPVLIDNLLLTLRMLVLKLEKGVPNEC